MRLLLSVLLVVASATPALARTYAFPHVFDQKGRITFDDGTGTSVIPLLPADFFYPGSDPFFGTVVLSGDSLVGRMEFGGPPLDTRPPTIPVELVQLSLVSAEPIIVHNTQLGVDGFFDVFVDLHSTPAPGQYLQLGYDASGASGQVFDSFFDITYEIEFVVPDGVRDGSRVLTNTGPGLAGRLFGLGTGPLSWSLHPGPLDDVLLFSSDPLSAEPYLLDLSNGSLTAELGSSIPEPSTLIMLGAVGLALAARRGRQTKARGPRA